MSSAAGPRSQMRFRSPYQHSASQLKALERLAEKPDPNIRELTFLLSENALHGGKDLPRHRALLAQYDRPDIRRFTEERRLLREKVAALPGFDAIKSDARLGQALYRLDRPYFERGAAHPEKLLILFTTMFNNFELSNPAILALLRPLGISILILKDASCFNYLLGIPGFGDDIEGSLTALKRFIAKQPIAEVYISGYSGAGYASLMLSTLLPCNGYLGFSVRTDLAAGSPRSPGSLFTEAARAQVPVSLCRNLAPRINAGPRTTPYRIIYGSLSERDRAHAHNIADRPAVSIEEIAGCGHFPITRLLMEDRLGETFRSMLFQN